MLENSNKVKEEYLCKAKTLNSDEWVIGYYVRLHSSKKIIHRIYPGYAEQDNEDFYPDYYDINPDTLSRFSGVYDRDCRMIFENSIVKICLGKTTIIGKIEYQNGKWIIINHKYGSLSLWGLSYDSIELIGNAYDNPKLLDKTNNSFTIKDFLYNGKVKIIALPSREVSEKSIYHSLMGKEGEIVAMSGNIIGVKIDDVSNPESKYDCFWFDPNCLEKIQ